MMRTTCRDRPRGMGTTYLSPHSSSGADHGSVSSAGSGRVATTWSAMAARLDPVDRHAGRQRVVGRGEEPVTEGERQVERRSGRGAGEDEQGLHGMLAEERQRV